VSEEQKNVEGQIVRPPSRKLLMWQVLGALAAAGIITVFFILPAEYGIDPTGFGKA
jgi:hypothetical protein